jgi:hypothetical protein
MTILDQIKLYHWQTYSYSRHKATDELHQNLSKLIDTFVETLHGRISYENENKDKGYKILLSNKSRISLTNIRDNEGTSFLKNIKDYLTSNTLNDIINNCTELQTLRDEMLVNINQTNYLFYLN